MNSTTIQTHTQNTIAAATFRELCAPRDRSRIGDPHSDPRRPSMMVRTITMPRKHNR